MRKCAGRLKLSMVKLRRGNKDKRSVKDASFLFEVFREAFLGANGA